MVIYNESCNKSEQINEWNNIKIKWSMKNETIWMLWIEYQAKTNENCNIIFKQKLEISCISPIFR
jgi:hypothetical protein